MGFPKVRPKKRQRMHQSDWNKKGGGGFSTHIPSFYIWDSHPKKWCDSVWKPFETSTQKTQKIIRSLKQTRIHEGPFSMFIRRVLPKTTLTHSGRPPQNPTTTPLSQGSWDMIDMIWHQLKECTIIYGEIPQNEHTFAVFDPPPKTGNLMTPVSSLTNLDRKHVAGHKK